MGDTVDQQGPLWKDIVRLLTELAPMHPVPPITPETKFSRLRIDTQLLRRLKHNWNFFIDFYHTGREYLTFDESEDLATAGDAWFRIAKDDDPQ